MDDLEAAKARVLNGNATSHDEWVIKRAEEREIVRKDFRTTDGSGDLVIRKVHFNERGEAEFYVPAETSEMLNSWWKESFDLHSRGIYEDTADALTGLREQFEDHVKNVVHGLEIKIARLEGELRALRGVKLWKPGE